MTESFHKKLKPDFTLVDHKLNLFDKDALSFLSKRLNTRAVTVILFKKLEQEQEIRIENERNLRDGPQNYRVNQEKNGFYIRKIDEEKRMLNDVLENSRTR